MANDDSLFRDLERFLNRDTAFGPDHFGAIGVENLRIFEQLFDSENKIYSRMSFKTPLVIGRRGSGKSTFLQSRKISEKTQRQVVVEINSGRLFSAFAKRIASDDQNEYVEVIAENWAAVFDLCLLVATGGEPSAPQPLATLYQTFRTKYQDGYRRRGTATTGRVVHYFSDFNKEMLEQIQSDVRVWTKLPLDQVRDICIDFLRKNDKKAVCLIDSLEEYKLSKTLHSDSLAGLFKCTGEFSASREGAMQVHVSIPSELFSLFTGYVSRGVMKDFSNATWLYWHASELLSVCAKRLYVFLQMYGYSGWQSLNLRRLNDKKECLRFLQSFLPQHITSSSGTKEDPVAYLLRHTQLIPRHLIAILNQVFQEQEQSTRNGKLLFSESSIKEGVERKLKEISEDIITGYREKYPSLHVVLEAIIPNLPLYFSASEVDRQYPKRVKPLLAKFPNITEYAGDAHSLLRTLLDVGAAGRVIASAETDVYVRAEFAYTIPSRDVGFSTDKDAFCFHPVFAKSFRCMYDPSLHKPVYPIGTDPEVALVE